MTGTAGEAASQTGTSQGGTDTAQRNTGTDAQEADTSQPVGESAETALTQTVKATVNGGRIEAAMATIGTAATGNIKSAFAASTRLEIGDGDVTVTVSGGTDRFAAGVEDAIAFVNAILTTEQIELASNGASVRIQLNVNSISSDVPDGDKALIEDALEEYRKELPTLTLGDYLNISILADEGNGEWNLITETAEPIDIVVEIPDGLKAAGREFYGIRLHGDECTLLSDMDGDDETITISSNLFSTYAVAYVGEDSTQGIAAADTATGKTTDAGGMSPVRPVLFAVLLAVWAAGAAWIILHRKNRKKAD